MKRNLFSLCHITQSEVLLAILAILHILPIWLIAHFPTQDGPSHIANAVILKEHSQNELYKEYFQLNLQPFPNWFSHATMAMLLHVASPIVAEKLLITLYAILFPLSIFYFVDAVHPGKRLLGTIGFIFAFNYLFHMGFYNFAFSVPMYFFAVGFWWKHREEFGWRRLLILNAIFVFTYFCHMVSLVLALATIFLLAAMTVSKARLRERLWLPIGLLPSYVLPLWFVSGRSLEPSQQRSFSVLFDYFMRIGSIVTYQQQLLVSLLLMGVLIGLVLYTLAHRFNLFGRAERRFQFQASDCFFVVFVTLTAIYFFAPEGMSGGGLISYRLCLFPFLVLLPALNQTIWRPLKYVFAVAITLVVLLQFQMNVEYYRKFSYDFDEYLSGMHVIKKQSTLLPITRNRNGFKENRVEVMSHVVGYYAAATQGVDLNNYEAGIGYFPIRFNPASKAGIDRPDPDVIHVAPQELEFGKFAHRVDYIVMWMMAPDDVIAKRVQQYYRLRFVSTNQRLRIYERMANVELPR